MKLYYSVKPLWKANNFKVFERLRMAYSKMIIGNNIFIAILNNYVMCESNRFDRTNIAWQIDRNLYDIDFGYLMN